MSRYSNDPRVTPHGNGFTVHHPAGTFHVLDTGAVGWGAFVGPDLNLFIDEGGAAIGAPTADDMICALIGEPDAAQQPHQPQAEQTGNRPAIDHADDCDGM